MAGMRVLKIIKEPSAAALAYGLDGKKGNSKQTILVFDMGGGTFDVCIMKVQNGVFDLRATDGNAHLGGKDLDDKMVSYCMQEFQREHGKDLSVCETAMSRLRSQCERAKCMLSSCSEAAIELDSLLEGIDFTCNISREKFEELSADFCRVAMVPVERALKESKIRKEEIDEVVLVGGATRMPRLQSMLRDYFGKEPNKSIDPDEAVAYGAAVQAGILVGERSKKKVVSMVHRDPFRMQY